MTNHINIMESTMNDNLHFLAANIACVEAEIQLDRVLYEAKTHMDNAKNFNEILNSLQKHSSSECVAYACELLGFDTLSQEATVIIKEQQTEKKQAFGARIRQSLNNWWNKFLQFLGWLKDKIGKFVMAIGRVLHLVKEPVDRDVKVSFNQADLETVAHNCENGTSVPKPVKKMHTISIKDVPKYMTSLKNTVGSIMNRAKGLVKKKETKPVEAEKEMLNMKQGGARWAQEISKEMEQMTKEIQEDIKQIRVDIKDMDKYNPGLREELLKAIDLCEHYNNTL